MKFIIEFDPKTQILTISGEDKNRSYSIKKQLKDCEHTKYKHVKHNVNNLAEFLIKNREWDHQYLIDIIVKKLHMMRDYFKKSNIVLKSNEIAEEIQVAINYYEEYHNHDDEYLDKIEKLTSEDVRIHYYNEHLKFKRFFRVLGEKMQGWWD